MQLKSFEVNTTAVRCKFMGFEKGEKCFVNENNFLHILPVQKPLIEETIKASKSCIYRAFCNEIDFTFSAFRCHFQDCYQNLYP